MTYATARARIAALVPGDWHLDVDRGDTFEIFRWDQQSGMIQRRWIWFDDAGVAHDVERVDDRGCVHLRNGEKVRG